MVKREGHMKYDIIIIGAGVIGTSIAYNLIPYDVSVLLLDKNNDVAMGSTRANSAIVHAGFDPKPGTLMAKLNVEGCALYEELCKNLSVPYKRCGSVVLAFSDEEKELLGELLDRGNKNGVPDLKILNQEELQLVAIHELSGEGDGLLGGKFRILRHNVRNRPIGIKLNDSSNDG